MFRVLVLCIGEMRTEIKKPRLFIIFETAKKNLNFSATAGNFEALTRRKFVFLQNYNAVVYLSPLASCRAVWSQVFHS